MLTPIRNRYVALLGLAGMVPLSWATAQGRLGLDVAATRAVILLLVLVVVDRVLVPLVLLVFSTTPPIEQPQRALPSPSEAPPPNPAVPAEAATPTQRRASDPGDV